VSLLEVDAVSVRFGGQAALNDVSLDATEGCITGLIGPNGAGKTTLFNVVSGLQAPNRGRVRIGGDDVTGLAPFKRARKGVARTFQRLELFGLLTVRENLAVAADIRRGWARRAGHHDDDETPGDTAERLIMQIGLAPVAEVRADALPTGQARLVELGRALATRPRLLLLDEPASGQDETETARFADILRTLAASGIGILLVEHDMGLVMDVCQRIHVLDFGILLASGTPEEIKTDPAVLAAYLGGSPSPGDRASGGSPAPGDRASGGSPAPGDRASGGSPAPGDRAPAT
jgi:branched-chain amino acid transport system ATP-binding protein